VRKTVLPHQNQALLACRAVMGLPRWKRTGGRDFVFYHSHPGFEWDDLDITNAYQETICNDFQVSTSYPHLEALNRTKGPCSPPERRFLLQPACNLSLSWARQEGP
jgi:hypothetical protein